MDHEIVDLNQYFIFRRDRENTGSKKSDGGGVFIVVKNKFSATVVSENLSDAEDMWVTINLDNDRLLSVCCVYLPPDDMAAYTSFSSKIGYLGLIIG